jgi:hypothetical protein
VSCLLLTPQVMHVITNGVFGSRVLFLPRL